MSTAEAPSAPVASVSEEEQSVGLERFQRPPIIDRIDARKLALIKNQIAPGASDAEVGWFLELAAHYDLDPFARELWCAKSKRTDGGEGKLLVMVGRDGLRKIVQRNGLHMDCDVVRANDSFRVKRTPDGQRAVEHEWTDPKKRGEIIGAWAEVRRGGPKGDPMGFFYAPIEEYRPVGASKFSPWSKQTSVMIMAAAERQAARQATPLSGLLVEGEDESIASTAVEVGSDDLPVGFWETLAEKADADLADRLRAATADWPPARVEMTLGGLSGEQLREVAAQIPDPERIDEREVAFDPETGEVLDEDVSDVEEVAPLADDEVSSLARQVDAAGLRTRIAEVSGMLDGYEPGDYPQELVEELDALELELGSAEDPDQGRML